MFSSVALLASTAISTVTGAKTVYSKLTTKVKVQEGKITKQSDKIVKLSGKVKNLETSVAKKFATLKVRNKELQIAKNAMTTQDGAIAKLGGKVKDLELKIKNTPAVKLPSKLAPANVKAIESTSNTVISKSLGMVSRNALSLPAQAIPFVGIAVIVGVTYLDVKASCEIVEELESLKKKLDMHVEAKTDERQYCGLSGKELWKKVWKTPKEAWETAKQYVPDLPDFSPAWEKTKEWMSPTEWQNWFKDKPDN